MEENTKIIPIKKENFSDFLNNFSIVLEENATDNIIINLLEINELAKEDLKKISEISKNHIKKNKKSFVLVNQAVTYADAPKNLNIVPTLQEAHDLIEMEEMQRDLGF